MFGFFGLTIVYLWQRWFVATERDVSREALMPSADGMSDLGEKSLTRLGTAATIGFSALLVINGFICSFLYHFPALNSVAG